MLIGVKGKCKIYGINIPELEKCVKDFQDGNISSKSFDWKNITKEQVILVFILHDLELRIVDKPATNFHFEYPRSKDENAIIDKEIQTFQRKLSIEEVANDTNTDFYSKLFTNRKIDSTNRTILNHKVFNKIYTTELFKMESINILINILKLGIRQLTSWHITRQLTSPN